MLQNYKLSGDCHTIILFLTLHLILLFRAKMVKWLRTLLYALRASQGGPPTSMENFLLGELRRAIDECGTCVAVIKLAARGDAQLRWDKKISHPS